VLRPSTRARDRLGKRCRQGLPAVGLSTRAGDRPGKRQAAGLGGADYGGRPSTLIYSTWGPPSRFLPSEFNVCCINCLYCRWGRWPAIGDLLHKLIAVPMGPLARDRRFVAVPMGPLARDRHLAIGELSRVREVMSGSGCAHFSKHWPQYLGRGLLGERAGRCCPDCPSISMGDHRGNGRDVVVPLRRWGGGTVADENPSGTVRA